jgi:MFS family permease
VPKHNACHHQPRNFFAYMAANTSQKIADELVSARLILPWMLASLGAPAAFAGFVVPIQQSGVLVPQLLVAAIIRRLPKRKVVWLAGALLSAACLGLMALVLVALDGSAAGWGILLTLTLFSIARGLCSVAAKDVIGKTISKGRRGSLMGYSAGLAGLATLILGVYIQGFVEQDSSRSLMLGLVLGSALLWCIALLAFSLIEEQPGSVAGGGNAFETAWRSLSLVVTDVQLRDFIIVRTLLLSVALAPPFYVLFAQQLTQSALVGLGLLVIASGIANIVSAPIWGRLGDRSSRLVMFWAAMIAALLGIGVFLAAHFNAAILSSPLCHAGLFLVLTIAHGGVRLGRKTYLIDLANADTRATYVAVSNTLIGVAMLVAGGIGFIADLLTVQAVILLLGVISMIAAIRTWYLPDVSQRGI